jgi:hypothetical protein
MASEKLNFSPWNARSIRAKRAIREYATMTTCCNINRREAIALMGFNLTGMKNPRDFWGNLERRRKLESTSENG